MWFRKKKKPESEAGEKTVKVPEGLWIKCENCKEIMFAKSVEENGRVCPKCDYHFRLSARERLELLMDDKMWEEVDSNVSPVDVLSFKDKKKYKDRIVDYQKATGLNDAVINATGTIGGIRVRLSVMEYSFMGGSMGSVVGEKITRSVESCLKDKTPLIIISCSGGARMQESVLSLMQMAKISSALALLHKAEIPYISIMTDPTTGGVTASYAMLGDINIAEPKSLIGFAGPRVIEQTIKQTLPEGFQKSEFLLAKGMLDMVLHRGEMKQTLTLLLSHLASSTQK